MRMFVVVPAGSPCERRTANLPWEKFISQRTVAWEEEELIYNKNNDPVWYQFTVDDGSLWVKWTVRIEYTYTLKADSAAQALNVYEGMLELDAEREREEDDADIEELTRILSGNGV